MRARPTSNYRSLGSISLPDRVIIGRMKKSGCLFLSSTLLRKTIANFDAALLQIARLSYLTASSHCATYELELFVVDVVLLNFEKSNVSDNTVLGLMACTCNGTIMG